MAFIGSVAGRGHALGHFGNSPEMAERMAALIPGAQAVILPGLRHMGLAENPDAVNSVLAPFLEKAVNTDGKYKS